MKITGIEIGEYRQFKNIKFDFTYPEGHPKAGQPLEKVCFIGQSGTGKTTLLNAIWHFFLIIDDGYQALVNQKVFHGLAYPYRTLENVILLAKIDEKEIRFGGNIAKEGVDRYSDHINNVNTSMKWIAETGIQQHISELEKICIYIDESALSHAYALTVNKKGDITENRPYIASTDEIFLLNEKRQEAVDKLSASKVTGLNIADRGALWPYLLSDVDKYDEGLNKVMTSLLQKQGFSKPKFDETYNEWLNNNSNSRVQIADKCLNPILSNFFLEVDTYGTEAPIVIKTKDGVRLAYNELSTGTKQLLTTALPIFKSKIENGVVLFDEPERSLFPDIQRELVKYYTSLAPEAQFFFATHSPIIASAFEPCERFILYFNENGEVNYRKGIAPEGDDPNDILSEDFGLNELMLEAGLDAYRKYRELATKIREEKDEEKKNQLIAERAKLGNAYNF
jgi:AAA15 family ATPase/GTPase